MKAVRLQIMELGEPDASGRRSPVPVEGAFETLEIDTLISAIGQRSDLSGFDGLPLTRKGTIEASEINCSTGVEGVFAAGDVTNKGASIAIAAIAEGDLAAKAINAYLAGEPMDFAEPYYSERNVTPEMLADRKKEARAVMSVKDPSVRRGNFEQVIDGFTDEQARKEASRCLECGCHDFAECKLIRYANMSGVQPQRFKGSVHESFVERRLGSIERNQGKCMLCNLCVRTCREEVGAGILGLVGRGINTVIKPEFDDPAVIEKCKECGRCAEVCPTGALRII